MRSLAIAALVASLSWSPPARALPNVRIGGFLQPSFELIDHDPLSRKTTIGFAEFRARVLALGDQTFGDVTFDFRFELEALPQPSLFDAWMDARGPLHGGGSWRVVIGQQKAPFSRQVLVWDPDIQMITKAWVTELAPAHQLGLSGTVNLPYVPSLQLSAGLFNGEGRNAIENVDKNFLYVGRIAWRPVGTIAPLVESGLGEDQLSIAANVSYNLKDVGDSDETTLLVGGDVFFSWRGLSAYGELVYGDTRYAPHDPAVPPASHDFHSLGWNVQAGWALPLPGWFDRRFEITGRFQGITRNDYVPLANPGDLNQTHYDIVAGLNYFQLGHAINMMLNYHHYILPGDPNRGGTGCIVGTPRAGCPVEYDAIFLSFNFRLEYAP